MNQVYLSLVGTCLLFNGCVRTLAHRELGDGVHEFDVVGNSMERAEQQFAAEGHYYCPREFDVDNIKNKGNRYTATVRCFNQETKAAQDLITADFESTEKERLKSDSNATGHLNSIKEECARCAATKIVSSKCEEVAQEVLRGSFDDEKLTDNAYLIVGKICLSESSKNYLNHCKTASMNYRDSNNPKDKQLAIKYYRKGCEANDGESCTGAYLLSSSFDKKMAANIFKKVVEIVSKECASDYKDSCADLEKISNECDPRLTLCKDIRLEVAKNNRNNDEKRLVEKQRQDEVLRNEEDRAEEKSARNRQIELQQEQLNAQERAAKAAAWRDLSNTLQKNLTPPPTQFSCSTNSIGSYSSTNCSGH
jgi:TPR repeat protein